MTKEELENKIGMQIQFLTISGKSKESTVESLVIIAQDYANTQNAIDKKPLRRLTEMNMEEFDECFGIGYGPTYGSKMISTFSSLFGIHQYISLHGKFDTYQKLVDLGFDVEFKLGRNG